MPYFVITTDTSQFNIMAESTQEVIANAGEGLLYAVEGTIMSDLALLSTTVWNVRTGTYAYGWTATQTDPLSVEIDNMAPYDNALEDGWTTRDGGFMPGGEVLGQAIDTNIDSLGGLVEEWLTSRLGV